ncbi:MAG: efflux RND transporter permease subunit [Pseudomonadota bacterium]
MSSAMNPAVKESSWRDLFFRNAHLLVLAVLVIALAGASALNNLPRIEDPRITTRNALIITTLPGASAERVEALVTKKLEEELREVEEIKDIVATSRANISVISIELEDAITSATNEQAFSRVRDRLAEAEAELPPGAGKPSFDDERGASAFSVLVGIAAAPGSQVSMGMLTRLGEELADRLRGVPGAERVKVYGDTEEEITVTLDRGELAAQGLSARNVGARIAAADPKNAAGALRGADRDLFLEVAGELDSVARIRDLVVREGSEGRQLRLGDVATVEKRWREPPDSYAYLNGQRIVFVASASAESVRIDRWQRQADVVLEQFQAGLDEGIVVDVLYRQNEYTEERLSSLSNNLLLGAAVVMLVVFFGLGWRAALIVGAALPLSASATLFGLTFFDQQIHQMSIFGMIIAIGLLIDNAIVVTDEIQKRLARGEARRAAVAASVGHLFVPLLASTVTTILGFMPIFLLPGNAGDFVSPIAISVVLALIASFLISMTIIAALAGRLIKRGEGGRRDGTEQAPAWWQRGVRFPNFNRRCEQWLTTAFKRPLTTAAASLLLPVCGFVLAGTLGLQFFPPADRDQFEIEVWMQEDSSLARTRATALDIEAAVREFEGVEQVSWLIGGSHPQIYYNRIMKQDSNAAYAHAMVKAASADAAERIVVDLQTLLDNRFPEAQIIVAPFAQGPPVDAPVGFRISGPSLSVLAEKGEELRRVMYETESVTHTRTSQSSRAKLKYAAAQSDAERVGLTLDDIAFQMQGNLEGFTGGSVREDLEDLPVRIRYADDVRGSLADIASMPLLAGNEWVPADTLGAMRVEPESASITRRNGERVNVVHGWVRPGALPIEVTTDILANLDASGFNLPPGYTLRLEGDSDAQQEAVGNLMTYLPILVMLMVTTLVLSFGSGSAAAVVGLVAFLSAGLGMLSLWLGGYNLGFNPLLGTAGLIGIAINGSIVVLAALRADHSASGGDVSAVVAITMQEARHVLATTATTIGGFLPLLIFTGGEFWPPLAVVIAGGVGFAVTLSLLLTPALFTLLSRRRRRESVPAARAVPAVIFLGAFLGGCAVGPDYVAPEPDAGDVWLEAYPEGGSAEIHNWWQGFDDPLIAEYVTTALEANKRVDIASARLIEARALSRIAGSALLPQLGADGNYTRFRLSEQSPNNPGGLVPRSGELFDTGFDASFELDLFGGNRRRNQAGRARAEAAEANLEDVRLSVVAEVVRTAVELRGSQRRFEVATQNEALQQETLELVERRVASGLSPELDALNARAQLEGTRSSLPELEAMIRSAALRLSTLTAKSPQTVVADFAVVKAIPEARVLPTAGLRGEVLRRRPDIRAAERSLAAATADIGVAVAAFFPKLSLSASFGWEAFDAGDLFTGDTEASGVLGAAALPLFTGGRLRAELAAANARQRASAASYEQAVLLAVEESEAALTRYSRSVQSRDHLSASAQSSAEAAAIARKLYESGLTDFLSVLDADRRRLEAEDSLAARRTAVAVNLVAVYKSLGTL